MALVSSELRTATSARASGARVSASVGRTRAPTWRTDPSAPRHPAARGMPLLLLLLSLLLLLLLLLLSLLLCAAACIMSPCTDAFFSVCGLARRAREPVI